MILEYIKLLETTKIEQCFYSYKRDDKCCALGLARIDFDSKPGMFTNLLEEIAKYSEHPITDLNDVYKWDFKKIAAYLRERYAAVHNVGDGQADRPGYDGFNQD